MSPRLFPSLAGALLVGAGAFSLGFFGVMAQEPARPEKGLPKGPSSMAPLLVGESPGAGGSGALVKITRNPAKLAIPQRNVFIAAQRAMEWLHKANRPDGRFVHGFVPALRAPLEGDNFLHQAGATFALARAARFFEDERAGAISRQATLTLLLETAVDPADKSLRYSAAPDHLVPRGPASALLVLAINDLPNPGPDLLDQADQLTQFLRTLPEGSGTLSSPGTAGKDKGRKDGGSEGGSGVVLFALARSQGQRPAPWKLEALRKACLHHQNCWDGEKSLPLVPWHTAAFTEMFLQTREKAFGERVFAMNDWLCDQQYTKSEPRRGHWVGGFMTWQNHKMLPLPPDIHSAEAVFSLSQACRVAREIGDAPRLARYQKALEAGLYFLGTLQYTDANAQHFSDWFRPAIVGGYHASHQDGNLRIDYTQNVLLAQVEYLAHLVDW